MPDYNYLLENRLTADQQNALRQLREIARESGFILFLTGEAVRDLHSGHAVRELEVSLHGNALNLKETLVNAGAQVWGEDAAAQTLYLCFPGSVRLDLISAHRVEYSSPGKPVHHPASIQEDLRRRDFTVNAMALSLNEGSFGLLLDPMNGAADIESRTLRLVSNYGFLEEPALLVRVSRLKARLGWEMDPRTQTRYENAREENVIEFLSEQNRRRELEQIGHEQEPLKVLAALGQDGWMQSLFPAWTPDKADEERLEALHALAQDLLAEGVHADKSAAQMQLLTARMNPQELAALKALMLRPGFVEEWNRLDAMAAEFQKALLAREHAQPSEAYKLFMSYDPESILWLGFTSKNAAVQDKFNLFLREWPKERQKIPHVLMQEMRITPELPEYLAILQEIFLQLIDGKLETPEAMKDFLEPYSPPAPPPTASYKRTRAKRGAGKPKRAEEDEFPAVALDDEDLDDLGADEEDAHAASLDEEEDLDESGEESPSPAPRESKPAKRGKAPVKSEPVKIAPIVAQPLVAEPVAAPEPKVAKAIKTPAKSVKKEKAQKAGTPAPAPAPKPSPAKSAAKSAPQAAKSTAKPSLKPAASKAPAAQPIKAAQKASPGKTAKPVKASPTNAIKPVKAAPEPGKKAKAAEAVKAAVKPGVKSSGKAQPSPKKPAPAKAAKPVAKPPVKAAKPAKKAAPAKAAKAPAKKAKKR